MTVHSLDFVKPEQTVLQNSSSNEGSESNPSSPPKSQPPQPLVDGMIPTEKSSTVNPSDILFEPSKKDLNSDFKFDMYGTGTSLCSLSSLAGLSSFGSLPSFPSIDDVLAEPSTVDMLIDGGPDIKDLTVNQSPSSSFSDTLSADALNQASYSMYSEPSPALSESEEPADSLDSPDCASAPDGRNFVDITPYLNMPQATAAKELGIPTSTLSKRWKEAVATSRSIKKSGRARKWPWRLVCKLDKEIMTLLHNVPPSSTIPPDLETRLQALMRRRQEELRPVVIRLN